MSETTGESRDGEDKCVSAVKKQIDRCRRTFRFSQPVDELRGVSAVLFSWIDLQFEVLPFPSPEPKWEAVLRLAGAAQ